MQSTKADKHPPCPGCGAAGRPVKDITLESLLKPVAKARLKNGIDWMFCATPECGTVYFAEEDGTNFVKNDLSVRVGIKETDAPRHVCYCFDHTIEEIEKQVQATGKSTVLADIRERMQKACWCETKSPLGSCCLATVTKHVKTAEKKFGVTEPESGAAFPVEDCCASPPVTTPGKSSTPERLAWVGGILAALIASACCWLPLLLVAVGVSGAAVSATFAAYRPYFMTLTFAFLGAAFWFAYRPQKTCVTEDSCCDLNGSVTDKKWGTNRALLWMVTAVAAAFLFFPSYQGWFGGGGRSLDAEEDLNVTVVRIEGMTCEGCASGLEKILSNLPGISGVALSYDEGLAKIGVSHGSTPPVAAILETIKIAGFSGQLSEVGEESDSSR